MDCLIQGGADLDHCDKDGYSALSLAALFGHLQVGKKWELDGGCLGDDDDDDDDDDDSDDEYDDGDDV